MAAKRNRPKPCELCRRRHRRILAAASAIICTIGGSIYGGLSLSSSTQAQTAAFIVASAPAKPAVHTQTESTQFLIAQERMHAAQIFRSQLPAATPTRTQHQTHAANPTTATAPTTDPTPTQTPVPRPTSIQSTPTPTRTYLGSDLGAELLVKAESMTGVPYVYGGATPSGFDCSGLIYWAAQQLGISGMPRDTYEMLSQGVSRGILVPTSSPQFGDLAFFGSGHVEFYIKLGETFGAQQPGTSVGYHSYGYGYVPTEFFRIV